jgi:hypothetical protein
LGFADLGFDVLALRALERQQFIPRTLGLYAEEPHWCSALWAVRLLDRIGMRGGWPEGGHISSYRMQAGARSLSAIGAWNEAVAGDEGVYLPVEWIASRPL